MWWSPQCHDDDGAGTASTAMLSRLEEDGTRDRQRPTQFQQSQQCQAVTAGVYVDIHSSELKAKNVIITGLDEAEDCTDKTLASNLFSAEFGEQPNIVHGVWETQAVQQVRNRIHCWCHLTTLIQLNILSQRFYKIQLTFWCGIMCISTKIWRKPSHKRPTSHAVSDVLLPYDVGTNSFNRRHLRESEWVSSCLTAHQHNTGYSVPIKVECWNNLY